MIDARNISRKAESPESRRRQGLLVLWVIPPCRNDRPTVVNRYPEKTTQTNLLP